MRDENGASVASSELLAQGPLVVTFYRGAWRPYCNIDLAAIKAAAEEIRGLGAWLLAISPQTAVSSRKIKSDRGVSFPVLSDPGNETAERFGLRFRLPDELIGLYKRFGVDLPAFNGEASWTLPMPARYVIDADGRIAYAEVNPDYTRRPDPQELLPTLRRLRGAAAA